MARRFVYAFLAPTLAFSIIFGALTVFQQKNIGDLTRIGRWPQRDFTRQDPVLTFARDDTTPGPLGPQVAVIGDSFSQVNVWQTVFIRHTGLQVTSWDFGETTCVLPWVDKIAKDSPRLKVVIVELVERSFLPRASDNLDCPSDRSKPWNAPGTPVSDQPSYWPVTLNVEFVGHSLLHSLQIELDPKRKIREDVVNIALNRSDLFSNRASNRLLYLTADETDWHASVEKIDLAIDKMVALKAALAARHLELLVLIVPDKSHTYRHWMTGSGLPTTKPNLAQALQKKGINAPDLLPYFEKKAALQKDFFRPDDTHLSISGFEYLGDLVNQAWSETGPHFLNK